MLYCVVGQGIWRPVLGRLQLLLHAVPLYGIQPPGRTGFPPDALMSFVTQAFNSPNGEVRNAAIKVTTEVYRLMGSPVEKYLKGIKPLIKEVIHYPPFASLLGPLCTFVGGDYTGFILLVSACDTNTKVTLFLIYLN